MNVGWAKSSASVTFCAHFDKTQLFHVDAFVVSKISSKLPMVKVEKGAWAHLRGLTLADPEYNIPADIDMLIGAELYFQIVEGTRKLGHKNSPIAIKSTLGWLIGGGKQTTPSSNSITVQHTNAKLDGPTLEAEPQLDELLRRFWEVESGPAMRSMSAEDKKCEEHFLKNYSRDATGRFVVKYPFKNPRPQLGESLPTAVRRFKQVERRLEKNQEFKKQYVEFMREYETLGHMIEVPPPADGSAFRYYIPHHFVQKESSTSTKFRVVFDGSCKTSNGVSLNDTMMVGPQIQDLLASLIMKFRINKIALSADIQRMFRTILVDREDQEYQHIVYRTNPDQQLKHYRLVTVTYGLTSSPYLAIKTLQTLAELEKKNFPLASAILKQQFYVDDMMSGTDTIADTISLQKQMIQLLATAKMSIRKFSSNSEEVLQSIPAELRENQSLLSLDKEGGVKTLGIRWEPAQDVLTFNTENMYEKAKSGTTKRIILSEISRLFDPLGWIAPVIVRAKIIMQSLWRESLDWDDIVPNRISIKWEKLKLELLELKQLKIPRHHPQAAAASTYIVGFCDASQQAYAACVYLCTYPTEGAGNVSLIASKTRVAPSQVQSLPRLELCGAVLLTELIPTVIDALKIDLTDVFAYTDSTLVLRYIRSEPFRFQTFVANRITKIQEKLGASKWGFVPGTENPADAPSRGLSVGEFITHQLWWHGPSWLSEKPPTPTVPKDWASLSFEPEDELKQTKHCHVTATRIAWDMFEKYSNVLKLQRVVAVILRYCKNLKIAVQRKKGITSTEEPSKQWLTTQEQKTALLKLIKIAQEQDFAFELALLRRKETLPRENKLLPLNPFIDATGLLRVGGRLHHANINVNRKHPILLPRDHRLTSLIVQHAHIINLHAGNQSMMSFLQNDYWIIRAKDLIRRITGSCITCRKLKAETMTQIMANLPSFRVNPSPPFEHCGVDYCGPFLTKPITPRSKTVLKSYIAVFICCSTRAIHLEVVSSASTASFMACLRRFIGRRGKPSHIYSDNGTNFIGANKELKELVELVKSEQHNKQVADQLSIVGVTWKFNCAAAPHHGGYWESGVKSTKYHLKRIMGLTKVTYEELTTLTSQIEAILNSRPLTPESNDPTDLNALTPGHFLIGQPLTTIPDPDLTLTPTNRLIRWELIQLMVQQFWSRWKMEFINRLQQRPKWMKIEKEITKGSMVILKDETLPVLHWKLGRIMEVHPGADGHIRTVTVKTASGEYKRPIVKVCLLPIETAEI